MTEPDISAASQLRLQFWGEFSITDLRSGDDLRPRGRRARAVVAYLACHADRAVSRERLAGLFWGDRGEVQARSSLRQVIFELRAFGLGGAGLIKITRNHLILTATAMTSDMDELLAAAAVGDLARITALRPDADELWLRNLDGLSESFDDWLAVERARRRADLDALLAPARSPPSRVSDMPEASAKATAPRGWRWPAAAGVTIALTAALIGSAAGRQRAALLPPAEWAIDAQTARSVASKDQRKAQALLQTSRGLVRTRRFDQVETALRLLDRALTLQPGLADAWALRALALTVAADDAAPTANFHAAEAAARRALALDPWSADAHAALGMVLGFSSPEARKHLEQAVALSPNDPEKLFWLSNARLGAGDFTGELTMLRRSVAIDPWWERTAVAEAVVSWELGQPRAARASEQSAAKAEPNLAIRVPMELAEARGELGSVVRRAAAAHMALGSAVWVDDLVGSALLTIGETDAARPLLELPSERWPIVLGAVPPLSLLAMINRDCPRSEQDGRLTGIALRTLLRDGRPGPAIAQYDSGQGCLGTLMPGKSPDLPTLISFGPDMALALKQAGREAEASLLLHRVDDAARQAMAHSAVPPWLLVGAGEAAAALDRPDEAIDLLATAANRGWLGPAWTPRPDIAALPTLVTLAGSFRFETLRAHLRQRIQAQQQMIAPRIVKLAAGNNAI